MLNRTQARALRIARATGDVAAINRLTARVRRARSGRAS